MTTRRFTQSSDLPVSVEVFLSTFSMHSVNAELSPLVKIVVPRPWRERPVLEWPVKERLFTSWILLIGVLPVDRQTFYLLSTWPGRGFIEQSTSLVNRKWRHQREVTSVEGGCRVTDTVEFDARLPLLGRVLKPVYELVFRQRHRNLISRFAGRPVSQV